MAASTPAALLPALRTLATLQRDALTSLAAYAAATAALSVVIPLALQALITLVTGGVGGASAVSVGALVVAATVLVGLVQLAQLRASEHMEYHVIAQGTHAFGRTLARADVARLAPNAWPEQMNRVFDLIALPKMVSKLAIDGAGLLLQIVAGSALLVLYHPTFLVTSLAIVMLLAAWLAVSSPQAFRTSLDSSVAKYALAQHLESLAQHVTLLRHGGADRWALGATDTATADYLVTREARYRALRRQAIGLSAIMVLATAAMLLLGATLLLKGQLTLGQFVAAEFVIVSLIAGVKKLLSVLENVYDATAAFAKVAGVLELPAVELAEVRPQPLPGGHAARLLHLGARYPGAEAPALQDVTLTLRRGEHVAVTGADDSGRHSLLRVLAGLLPHDRGTLEILGHHVLGHDRPEGVAAVFAEDGLVPGTLETNLLLGRSLAPDDRERAAGLLGLDAAVAALPAGWQTPVTAALTHRMQHVLVLARALAGNPQLLLLDDAVLHGLSAEARQALFITLRREWPGLTVVCISDTPEVLERVDRVVRMADRRVATPPGEPLVGAEVSHG